MNKISIDPITRLEGHGKIDIFLDDQGEVADCYFIVPELRGFEVFCVGRPVEEMPRITSRICGVCSEAHHLCSAKACDAVYGIDIPPAAKKLRELMYSAFLLVIMPRISISSLGQTSSWAPMRPLLNETLSV